MSDCLLRIILCSYAPEVQAGLLFVDRAFLSQAYTLTSLLVPVIYFLRPGLPAYRFLRPAYQGLSIFLSYPYHDNNIVELSIDAHRTSNKSLE